MFIIINVNIAKGFEKYKFLKITENNAETNVMLKLFSVQIQNHGVSIITQT